MSSDYSSKNKPLGAGVLVLLTGEVASVMQGTGAGSCPSYSTSGSNSLLLFVLGKQPRLAHVHGALPLTWETPVKFLGFGLARHWPLQPSEE